MKLKITKKGLTLVELVISIALLSVVLAAIGVALASYGSQYASMTQRLRAQEAASLIAERIELSVRYSEIGYISTTDSSFGCNMISSHEGKLYYKAAGASDFEAFIESPSYNGYNCNVIFTKSGDNGVNAEIIIYKGEATDLGTDAVSSEDYLYRTNRTIRLLNTTDDDREFVTNKISDIDGMTNIFKYK